MTRFSVLVLVGSTLWGTAAGAATFYFEAAPTTATSICLAPCFHVRMFYEDASGQLLLQALRFDLDVFGDATADNLPVPPATNGNAQWGNTSPEDENGNIAVLPWDQRAVLGGSSDPAFDAAFEAAATAPFTIESMLAVRNAAVGCTPASICSIQLGGLNANRVYLGRFNVTAHGGAVALQLGTVTGEGPAVLDPVHGLARLSGYLFPIQGFPSPIDSDGDGYPDGGDNCIAIPNPDQTDSDGDGVGDTCNDAIDADGDEWSDTLDNCPALPNPGQQTRDGDELGDVCDLCPDFPTSNNGDFDGNGIGDECECGDQTRDGVVNVLDIVGINLAIFGQVLVSPLCDTNYDGRCNVQDIVGANAKIFGRPAYCSRYPPPAG